MISNKKITIIGSAYPLRGGLATYNERLARAFQEAGNKVTIETFSLQYPSFLFPGKSQYATWSAPNDLKINVSVNSINPINWIRTGWRIRKARPDIVIIKYWLPFMAPCFGTLARIIKGNGHTRIISIVDNFIPHEKRIGDRIFTRYFAGCVDGYVAMSRAVLQDIQSIAPNQPQAFCPHPLYDNFGQIIPRKTALENLNLDPRYRYLLFFGFIRDYKGLDLLLEAFADSRIRQHSVKLIVAGEFYVDEQPYLSLIEKYNLPDHVILKTDFIPDSEVVSYFCAADMVVQPYKSATQSGVTQIAYHFEKPMLVTNVGGLAEIVPDGKVGYVIAPEIKTISDSIVDFFQNNRLQPFTQNVREYKKQYSWERMIETIQKLYQPAK